MFRLPSPSVAAFGLSIERVFAEERPCHLSPLAALWPRGGRLTTMAPKKAPTLQKKYADLQKVNSNLRKQLSESRAAVRARDASLNSKACQLEAFAKKLRGCTTAGAKAAEEKRAEAKAFYEEWRRKHLENMRGDVADDGEFLNEYVRKVVESVCEPAAREGLRKRGKQGPPMAAPFVLL